MGSQTGEPNEMPMHRVSISDFCMDTIEVTVSAYAMCPTEAGCSAPSTGPHYNWGVPERESHPVNGVDWNQAMAFCRWRDGGSLPTEAQWEFAAKGTTARVYPWGNDQPVDQLCWSGNGITRSSTCFWRDVSALGASPFAINDMAGNVWEWVFDGYDLYRAETDPPTRDPTGPTGTGSHVLRGGSWGSMTSVLIRTTGRAWFPPTHRSEYIGFRCAHNPL